MSDSLITIREEAHTGPRNLEMALSGHPLKKSCFRSSGQVTLLLQNGNFFFLILPIFLGGIKISSFSYPPPPPPPKKKKKKKNLRPPDWPQFRPPATQETNFFLRVASDSEATCTSIACLESKEEKRLYNARNKTELKCIENGALRINSESFSYVLGNSYCTLFNCEMINFHFPGTHVY